MTASRRNEMAVVTGGAVRLGREIALGLARAGYSLGLHYHGSEAQAAITARDIESLGIPVTLYQADLRDPDQVEGVFEQVSKSTEPLRVLVNSASIMPRGNLKSMGVDAWDATLDLNLRAPWLCARAAGRLMEAAGGVIINVSDSGAGKTWTGFPAYTISKAGLEVLTRLLARTLAPNIRVNAVAPGLILPSADTPEEDWQRLVKRLPVQKAGTPQDIVQAIYFLIENKYVTGETLHVDGGYQLV